MKKNIFLYLFIFVLLINVFTYMYFTNQQKYEAGRVENMQKKVKSYQDSLSKEEGRVQDAEYFTLTHNDNALEYFAESMPVDSLETKIKDGVMSLNANAKGNPLVGYEPINDKNWLINKVQVLNHRWIIADFSNGKGWGEVLIKYFIDPDGSVKYETIETVLYADTVN